MWTVLAETIREGSNSRTSTYKLHLRAPGDRVDGERVWTLFEQNLRSTLDRIKEYRRLTSAKAGAKPNVRILCDDSRSASIAPTGDEHMVLVTSPPYGDNQTTIPYGQFSYLAMRWIPAEDLHPSAAAMVSNTHYLDTASLGGSLRKVAGKAEAVAQVSPSFARMLETAGPAKQQGLRKVSVFMSDLLDAFRHVRYSSSGAAHWVITTGNRRANGVKVPLGLDLQRNGAVVGRPAGVRPAKEADGQENATQEQHGRYDDNRDNPGGGVRLSEDTRPELKLSSHVLVQLGSELVTDVEQAILECVKNAYDADSIGCKITIDTLVEDTVTEVDLASRLSRFKAKADNVKATVIDLPSDQGGAPTVERRLAYKGSIEIRDFGDGLTEDQLRTSWLVISGSSKRAVSGEPKKKTQRNRTPLGDKGLGRLGTMRLGDILKVETATSPDGPLSTAWFRWADCKTAETIDQIPVRLETKDNKERFKGTKVTVLGLNDLPEWNRDNRLNQITRSMMRLISPFEATSKFLVTVALNGVEQSLAGLTEDVLNRAVARYDFAWTMNLETETPELRMTARFKRALFEPTRSGPMREKASISFTPDEGAGFFKFLAGYGRLKRYEPPRVDRNGAWILEIEKTMSWSEIMAKDKNKTAVVDPGPFKGSIYYFFLDNLGEDTSNISRNAAEPIDRELIKSDGWCVNPA